MNQRELEGGQPVEQHVPRGDASPQGVDDGPGERPIQKPERGVVHRVQAERGMINVVSEACDEPVSVGNRRDLDQRRGVLDDQVA